MTVFHTQHVLRHDRKHAAQRERPERRRAQQDADADTRDVCACEIEPLAEEDSTQHQFGDECTNNRERCPLVALQYSVEKVTDDENESDKERRDVTIVETNPASLDRNVKSRGTDGLNCGLAQADSLIL